MKRREFIASLGSILAVWPLSARGQTTQIWPVHPVKLIVGFAPGGPTDLVARLVAQKLTEQTGKNFFVENIPGAGGYVGTVRAAKSSPDGYTFLVTGGNITNNQYLFAEPGYDPLKDFDPVTLAAATPVVLAVNPSVPVTTVKELVAWIRANPGKESYASPGTGTPPQLVGHCSSMLCSSIWCTCRSMAAAPRCRRLSGGTRRFRSAQWRRQCR